MAELKLRGSTQITIIDLTDGRRVVALINPNKQTSVIYDPDTNKYLPDYNTDPMVLTPQLMVEGKSEDLVGSAKSIRWAYQKNSFGTIIDITESNETFRLGSGNVKTLSIMKNIFATDQSIRIYCYITYTDPVTNTDYMGMSTMEINKLTNGSSGNDAVIGSLSNDAQYLSVSDLSQTTFSNVKTSMIIFDGVVDVTNNWSFSKTETSGITGTLVGNTYTLTKFVGEFGEVRITATRPGFDSITKVFTLAKIKHGEDGSSTAISTSSPVIKKSEEGQYSPTALEVKALYTVGKSTPIVKPVAFRISESISPTGETYVKKYTSSALEESISYRPSPDISLIRIEIFADTGLTLKIDEELVPIVLDGKDSIMPIITTPNGVTSRNSNKSLIATLEIYKGLNTVRGSFYQWYIMDGDATGDVNSGPGWRKLLDRVDGTIKGSNSPSLEISPTQINGTDTFLVVSSFLGNPIKMTVDLSDLADPFTVSLLGPAIFKNGEGENTYTAKVYQNGDEIDSVLGEYKYVYKWSMYSADNVRLTDFSKLGKQITVSRSEISSTGFLMIEVEDSKGATIGVDRLDLTDLSDAIVSGDQPSTTIEGQLWIDTSDGGNVLKVFRSGSWQIQELDVTKLDSGLSTTIETITETLGSIVSDNKLTLADRVILATDLSRIIGYFPSTSTELVREVLPDSLDLDTGGVGDFATSRASARSLGINDNHPAMKAVEVAWNTLRIYLNELNPTIMPWDITEAHKDLVIDVQSDTFRSKWLDYYNAQLALQGVILAVPGPEGKSAVSGMLDNDSVIIPTDYNGENGIYEGAFTSMLIYLGTRDVTSDWSFTEKHSDGISVTLVGNKVTITEITVDSAWVDITASGEGYPSITRRFSVIRQKEATPGAEVDMQWLSVSTVAFAKDPLGNYFPAEAKLLSYTKTGNGTTYPYDATFVIEETSNGNDYVQVYSNGGVGKSNHVYTPSKNIKAARITLRDLETGNVIDTQSITVVTDGKDGNPGYTPIKGVDYFDGRSSYLHIRYSDDNGITFTANAGSTPGIYMGMYTDQNEHDSDDPAKYVWSKVRSDEPKFYQLLLSSYLFKFSSENLPEPANQTITIGGTYSGGEDGEEPVIEVYGIDSTGIRTRITPANVGVLVPGDLKDFTTLEVVGTYAGIADKTYISRVRDGFVGSDGVTSYLTNSAHTIVTDSYGNNGNYTGAVSQLKISVGNIDETDLWSITVDTNPAEVTGVLNGSTYTVSKIMADTTLITFRATRSGRPSINQVFTVTRLKKAEQVFTLVTDSSSGNVFNNNIATVLSARVFKGNSDITTSLPNTAFKWKRTSEDTTGDTAWNSAHVNTKNVIITPSDVSGTIGIFDCTVEFDETKY